MIPARDEERDIALAVRSALGQCPPPDRVLVVADNCTDETADRAFAAGAEVMQSVRNRGKKAGALNQALTVLDQWLGPKDVVLAMDADTEIAPDFLANATRLLHEDPTIAGCCASFHGKAVHEGGPGRRLLGLLQRMEYVRYQQSIARRKDATAVLSGTATAFRVGTLRRLKAERGYVYDESSMLEDYEISLALRHRGLRCVAPTECRSYTDVMPSVGRLWRQRLRWQRGTIEELRHYGFTRVTRRDVGLQLLVAGAVLSRVALVAALALTFAFAGGFVFNPLVIPMAAIIAFERAWTIRSLGWPASLAGLLLVFEEGYGVFRETFWCRSLWLSLRRRTWEWHPT